MRSLYEKISWFSYFGGKPKQSNLMWCLTTDRYKDVVEKIRNIQDTELRQKRKKGLPGFTPSGLFTERKSNGLIQHSGYICLDFDSKDNTHITDWQEFVYELGRISFVSFAGLSVSGKGAFVIVPISEPKRHTQHFDSLVKYFTAIAKVDVSGRDVGRFRFVSYNRYPYINRNADIYSDYIKPIRAQIKDYDDTDTNVLRLYYKIMETQTNITADYRDWFSLACSLRNVPNGRSIFHDISTMDDRYHYDRCECEFNKANRSQGRIGIGTFFHICKRHGIYLYK